jgi:uncharacterized protein YbjT (DUF2867 family)
LDRNILKEEGEASMNKTDKVILVTGATGQQGGAAIRHLIAAGWQVRALTRDLNKPAAQVLQRSGVEVVQGSTDDQASLEAAVKDVYGVFSVQPPMSYDDELRHGKNVADAARVAGTQHFVYTSVGGAEGQDAYRKLAKWEIEQYIQASGLPTTILRPAGFMDDCIGPRFGVPRGIFTIALKPKVKLNLIAVDDIGAFVNLAFEQPDQFRGKTLEIAGDSLVPSQIADHLSRALERSIPYVQIPMEDLRQQSAVVARVFDFYNEAGYQADIPALRKIHPGLMDFATWLEKEGKAKFEALPS